MAMDQPTVRFKLDDFVIKQGKRIGVDFSPARAHDTDAGADIRTPRAFTLKAHGSAEVTTGVHVELPPGTCGKLVSKSGLNIRHGVLSTGLIDEGYTGSIKVKLYNMGDDDLAFEAGDKITQLVVVPVLYPTYEQAVSIRGGERGDAGFGSTGAR